MVGAGGLVISIIAFATVLALLYFGRLFLITALPLALIAGS